MTKCILFKEENINWVETLLTKDFINFKWVLKLISPILYLLPEKYSIKTIIYFQTKFLDYTSYKKKGKTYGGFLENRADLIGFLEPSCVNKNMTHLGIDINNIKAKSQIKVPCDVEIIHVLKDSSVINGWGGRLIMKMKDEWNNCPYLIFGHLSQTDLPNVGEKFKSGQIITKLGDTNENGGWFVHLHVQCITQKFYNEYKDKLDEIDGYFFEDVNYLEYVSDPTKLCFK